MTARGRCGRTRPAGTMGRGSPATTARAHEAPAPHAVPTVRAAARSGEARYRAVPTGISCAGRQRAAAASDPPLPSEYRTSARVAVSVGNWGATRYFAPLPVTHAHSLSSEPRMVLAWKSAMGTVPLAASAASHETTTTGSGPEESEQPATRARPGSSHRDRNERIEPRSLRGRPLDSAAPCCIQTNGRPRPFRRFHGSHLPGDPLLLQIAW